MKGYRSMKLQSLSHHAASSIALLALALSAFVLPAHAELDIAEVTSERDVTAWLVEDPTDPMVVISFAFLGGTSQDPEGKEGMTDLMTSLLNEGAGDLDSSAFQQRFYETGADLSFRSSRELVAGTIRMLADETEEPLELLKLALTEPRFDEAPFTREQSVAISRVRAEANDPDDQGQRALMAALYGDHPLGRQATVESLQEITRDDLASLHEKTFARSDLFIGAVGNIDQERLATILDEVFGDLPAEADPADVPPPDINFGKKVVQTYDRPQSSIQMVYPAVGAKDAEIYTASLIAEMLGGSGLVSRLFEALREERGLTYSAGAYLDSAPEWGDLTVNFSTRGDQTEQAIDAAQQVIEEFATDGPSQEELDGAKQYSIGSYAISQLSSTSAIARTLVGLQRLGRGRDYLERRVELFDAVTVEDVQDLARQMFSVEPTTLIVGPVEDGDQ
ncbi:M16 family metallopeptidase [Chelativorans sp. YIM 93263]|uniref:M16 family metallopeptidase n=1 Tax=Chelativorans sp. YIM 93263 TaxID=2906648 RepID=UPI002379D32C|nr:pitrilysin family protein [Chelativorans sp. YIM 93263]